MKKLFSVDKLNNSFGAFFYDISGNEIYLKDVIYNNPAVICIWSDGTKTISKCHEEDTYDEEKGLSIAVLKKLLGTKSTRNLFSNWVVSEDGTVKSKHVTLKDVLKKQK